MENGDHIRLYYHMDYLGTADYLTSPVSGKVEAWTHYNEWGLISHNAVLKCGQRELDLVKRYATHDYDSVLELYYAKARFYDAHDRRFTAVDPILDPSGYDLREYVQNPAQLLQYLYVQNQPLVYIDPTGEVALTTTIVYAGTIFTVASLQAWFNTPSGKKAISTASGVIADAITYTGKGISNFVSGVISGTVGFVRTLVIVPPVNMKVITGEVLTGATQATAKVLTRDIEKEVREYMDKAGCEDDEESDSNPKSGNQKNDQSSSKPKSQGKDQSATNPGDPQKGDGGNGKQPIKPNQNRKFEKSPQALAVERFIHKNVPEDFQENVRNAFTSDAKVTTLTEDLTVYRYYGGEAKPSSFWFTPQMTDDPINDLALPPQNTANLMDTVIIPKGTTVLEGTVARNFGRPGGGYQIYVPNPSVIIYP